MRVLQLCHRIPYPPSDGGSIAMHQITEGLLKQGMSVKVLALSPTTLQTDSRAISNDYQRQTGFESVSIDTHVKLLPAFINLFTSEFLIEFCVNGAIDWDRLVAFNSGNYDLQGYYPS